MQDRLHDASSHPLGSASTYSVELLEYPEGGESASVNSATGADRRGEGRRMCESCGSRGNIPYGPNASLLDGGSGARSCRAVVMRKRATFGGQQIAATAVGGGGEHASPGLV